MITQTQRDKEIVELAVSTGLTLGQIGERYGLTRQRIFQIVQKHLKRQYVNITPKATPERSPHGSNIPHA